MNSGNDRLYDAERSANVGDLVRYRVQYLRDGYRAPEPWAPPTNADLIDAESQGIVRELRDDGVFVEESPDNLGAVGEGAWLTRTHSLLVTFDKIIGILKARDEDPARTRVQNIAEYPGASGVTHVKDTAL